MQRCSWVVEPANTWSNLAYLVVGVVIYFAARRSPSPQLRFFALQADASLLALVGVPALELSASELQVRLNQGSFAPGLWPALPGQAPPVVDFALSFPGANPGDDPIGYLVATDTLAPPRPCCGTSR